MCVYLPVLLIKRLRIAVFLLIKLKVKTTSCMAVFGCTTGNILVVINVFFFFFGLMPIYQYDEYYSPFMFIEAVKSA